MRRVFSAWAEERRRHHPRGPAPLLDRKRAKAIADRLADGFAVDVLERAAAGIWRSEWHLGGNERGREYSDLALALRDAEHVERFAELAPRSDPRPRSGVLRRPTSPRELTPAENDHAVRTTREAVALAERIAEGTAR